MSANFRQSPLFRTVLFFVCLLCIGVLLITLGRRNDAITEAQYRQAGVLTADEVSISARGVSAPLNHRLVQESEMVKAGQVLLELDDEDYKIALERLNAEYAQQESAIAAYRESIAIEEENLKLLQQSTQRSLERLLAAEQSAAATLKRTEADYKRYASLLKTKAVSQANYDVAAENYAAAQAAYTQAQKSFAEAAIGLNDDEIALLQQKGSAEGLENSEVKIKRMQTASMRQTLSEMEHYLEVLASNRQQAQLDLERTQIKAPCDGKVLTINYQEGEFVSAGAPALVLEKYERYLDVYLPETKALQYQPGQQVSLTRAVDHKVFTGVIRYLNPAPSYADLRMSREQGQADLTTYEMRIYTSGEDLLPGMTLELEHEHL